MIKLSIPWSKICSTSGSTFSILKPKNFLTLEKTNSLENVAGNILCINEKFLQDSITHLDIT